MMRAAVCFGLLLLSTVTYSAVVNRVFANDAAKAGQVLKHVVMYKFRDDCTPEQVQEVIDAFSALPKQVDTIIGFEKGLNVSQEGKSEGLTHCFVVTFRDEAGLQTYLKHPAHDAYVLVVKTKREKVIVFDYWAAGK
jgi:Stress responsive A/B Barrel Domain